MPHSPRRWFRFGLRTMFVVLTVLAMFFGWLGWQYFGRQRDDTENFYVGMSKQEILERLGPPTSGANMPSLPFSDEMTDRRADHFLYSRWNGDLLIRVWDEDGKQVCFASQLLPPSGDNYIATLMMLAMAAGLVLAFIEGVRRWNRCHDIA